MDRTQANSGTREVSERLRFDVAALETRTRIVESIPSDVMVVRAHRDDTDAA